MDTIHIPVVLGTARLENASEAIAKAVVALVEEMKGVTSELVRVEDHITKAVTVPSWGKGGADETPTEWKKIVEKSQALVLVIPEYNHGYPGELKLLLDTLYKEYGRRPVALVGVSAGTLGGARVVDHIQPVLLQLHLVPIVEALHVTGAANAVTEDGTFSNPDTTKYAKQVLEELVSNIELV